MTAFIRVGRRIRHSGARGSVAVGLALVLLGAGVGIAGAAIPQAGTYTGCYNRNTGALRVIDVAIASQKCTASERQITWSQTGPAGADGANGTNGTDGTNGTNGLSESFWSGLDGAFVPVGLVPGRANIAKTGPIAPGWWTVTGQLHLEAVGGFHVTCSLVSTAPGQTTRVTVATLYQGDFSDSADTIQIRRVVDASALGGRTVASIYCITTPEVAPLYSLLLSADILVIPTERGQVGVTP